MVAERDINEIVQRAELALVSLHRMPNPSETELAQVIESWQLSCQTLFTAGSEIVELLRELVFGTQYVSFSQAQTAARLLSELSFPESTQALLDAAFSPDIVVANHGWQALRCLPQSEANFLMLLEAFNRPVSNDREEHCQRLLIDALGRQTLPAFYPAAAQWMQEHSDKYVRRSLAMTLAVVGGTDAIPILQSVLNDPDDIVQIRAAFGLILCGQIELLERPLEALQSRVVEIRSEAVNWLGLIPLPSVTQLLLTQLSDRSTQVRMSCIVRVHDIGVRESLIQLVELLGDRNAQIVEQAAVMLNSLAGVELAYHWQGRRLIPDSIITVREVCEQIYETWIPNYRYLHGQPMTITNLANLLFSYQGQTAYWILVGMTGQRFGFDPRVDILSNWQPAQQWKLWAKNHENTFNPGAWYFLGHLQQ